MFVHTFSVNFSYSAALGNLLIKKTCNICCVYLEIFSKPYIQLKTTCFFKYCSIHPFCYTIMCDVLCTVKCLLIINDKSGNTYIFHVMLPLLDPKHLYEHFKNPLCLVCDYLELHLILFSKNTILVEIKFACFNTLQYILLMKLHHLMLIHIA